MTSYTITTPTYAAPKSPVPRTDDAGDGRRVSVDAAQTTDENKRHWAHADGLAPVSQLTPWVRRQLRNRARYEVLNGCYPAGLIRTLVGDTVGSGPRLQLLTPDAAFNANVEALWRVWAAAANWPLTTRLMCGVRWVGGECFGVFRDSKRLARLNVPVTLDLGLIEPDQVGEPLGGYLYRTTGDDGILCDADGDVVAYRILKGHPGDMRIGVNFTQFDDVAVDDVIHWFIPDRPGQLRGITPLTPALEILGQMRRFTAATLTAAEVAAMLAGVLKTNLLPDDGAEITSDRMWDTVPLVKGTLLTLPAGWEASQFNATQPTTTYQMFMNAKLREVGRAMNVPYGKMAGDHSEYNYSSARLEDQNYWIDRDVERQAMQVTVFDPFFYRWCEFAKYVIPGLIAYEGEWWRLTHQWHYDGRVSIDPVKDATGDEINLTNGTDTLAAIAARDGTTVEAILDQRKREMDMFRERGLPLPAWLGTGFAPVRTEASDVEAANAS